MTPSAGLTPAARPDFPWWLGRGPLLSCRPLGWGGLGRQGKAGGARCGVRAPSLSRGENFRRTGDRNGIVRSSSKDRILRISTYSLGTNETNTKHPASRFVSKAASSMQFFFFGSRRGGFTVLLSTT